MISSGLWKLIFFCEDLLWFYGCIGGIVGMSSWDSLYRFSWFPLFLTFDVGGLLFA